jgi:hypothetical protein
MQRSRTLFFIQNLQNSSSASQSELHLQFLAEVSAVGTLFPTKDPCQDKNVNIDADRNPYRAGAAHGKPSHFFTQKAAFDVCPAACDIRFV